MTIYAFSAPEDRKKRIAEEYSVSTDFSPRIVRVGTRSSCHQSICLSSAKAGMRHPALNRKAVSVRWYNRAVTVAYQTD